jgi:hypothetical protein
MPERHVRRLTVEPTAGLGNRLRVIDSAIALSRELGSALRIVWTRTPGLGCRFDQLFLPIRGIQIAERSRAHSRIVRHVGALLKYDRVFTQPAVERLLAAHHDFTNLRGARYPYIMTCSRFFPAAGHLEGLTAVPAIAARVEEAAARFTPFTVGVHIRRAGNQPSTTRSPTAAFIAEMSALADDDPRTDFFLATDDPAEEDTLRKTFGDRIVTLPKQLDRADPGAIKSALVDLLCLSRTRLVLGSHWSAFSEMAAEIGAVPLRVVDVGEPPVRR